VVKLLKRLYPLVLTLAGVVVSWIEMRMQLEISTSRGLSTVGHTGTFALDASNALGDESSTHSGASLSEQVMSLIKESQCL
jgi:putative transposase